MSDIAIVSVVGLIVLGAIAAFYFGRNFRADVQKSGLTVDTNSRDNAPAGGKELTSKK